MFFKLAIDVLGATSRLIGKDGSDCREMSVDEFEETTFFDTTEQPFELILLSGLDQINVILLEWNGGIGSLDHKAIDKGSPPGPSWKEIVLG